MIKREADHLTTGAKITFPHEVKDVNEALTIIHSSCGRHSNMQLIGSGDSDVKAMVGRIIVSAGELERYVSRSETSRGYDTDITGRFAYKCQDGTEYKIYY